MMVGENQWIKQNMSPLWFQWKFNKLKYLWTIEEVNIIKHQMKIVKFDYNDILWNPPLVSIILLIDGIIVLHWRM
jgi:hypothetical protein